MTELNYDINDADVKAAMLAKLAAETDKEIQLARKEAALAAQYEITLEDKRVVHMAEAAADMHHYVYRFSDSVDYTSVKRCMDTVLYWHRTAPQCRFEIVFNSPGGSVFDGMELFDFLQEMRREGHHVTTSARGMAASMGGILLQAGNHRAMGAEALVLIHQISTVAFGKVGEIEDEMKMVNKVSDRVLDIFAARAAEAGTNGTASDPITKARLKRGWERKDWWLDSAECLKYGLVDEIR